MSVKQQTYESAVAANHSTWGWCGVTFEWATRVTLTLAMPLQYVVCKTLSF